MLRTNVTYEKSAKKIEKGKIKKSRRHCAQDRAQDLSFVPKVFTCRFPFSVSVLPPEDERKEKDTQGLDYFGQDIQFFLLFLAAGRRETL